MAAKKDLNVSANPLPISFKEFAQKMVLVGIIVLQFFTIKR